MAKPQRQLTVLDAHLLSPNMTRIVFGGNDLKDFPENQESGYVKLLFPPRSSSTSASNAEQDTKYSTKTRSFTIRAFDALNHKLVLDFVIHDHDQGESGPASDWAKHAKIGDVITVSGPGPTKLVDDAADWFFIVGDMSALPAISVNIEKLPHDARGYAVIEIIDAADKQQIKSPEGLEIHWVINPYPNKTTPLLSDKVASLPWLEGKPNVWLACEFESMRTMRRYFKSEREVEKRQIYASSYWKIGTTDEGNKQAKALDLKKFSVPKGLKNMVGAIFK